MRKTEVRLLAVLALVSCVLSGMTPIHAQTSIDSEPAQSPPPQQSEPPVESPIAGDSGGMNSSTSPSLTPRAFVPATFKSPGVTQGGCPVTSTPTSTNTFGLIDIAFDAGHGYYKGNRLTDENADFRLSILGYSQTSAPLQLVDYGGGADPNAPRLHGVFEPNRLPVFVRAHKRFDWNWDEAGPPPYGARGGVNDDWPVSVLEFGTAPGEAIYIPERGPEIGGGFNAMVLYAGPNELTITYQRYDSVTDGYVIHLSGLCIEPQLLALYRAQLQNGRRATGRLPGVKNNQPVGAALSNVIAVAVRDQGAYLDPRSRKDWWQGLP
jgi:hypothetical protein